MGAVLDSAKNIRQDEKGPSRQAYQIEKKLEKDKDKGVNNMSSDHLNDKTTLPFVQEKAICAVVGELLKQTEIKRDEIVAKVHEGYSRKNQRQSVSHEAIMAAMDSMEQAGQIEYPYAGERQPGFVRLTIEGHKIF